MKHHHSILVFRTGTASSPLPDFRRSINSTARSTCWCNAPESITSSSFLSGGCCALLEHSQHSMGTHASAPQRKLGKLLHKETEIHVLSFSAECLQLAPLRHAD